MQFMIGDLTESLARELCSWKYGGEYAVYNFSDWEAMIADDWGITNAAKRGAEYRSVHDENGRYVGFFRMTKTGAHDMEIGLGMEPSYCGRGFGSAFVRFITAFAQEQYPDYSISLEVRAFNKRAIRCYEKSGYEILRTYRRNAYGGECEYVTMRLRKESGIKTDPVT